jgi:hypothetical protein
MICPTGEAKYFCKGGLDRANQVDPVQQIRFYAQIPGMARSTGYVDRTLRGEKPRDLPFGPRPTGVQSPQDRQKGSALRCLRP